MVNSLRLLSDPTRLRMLLLLAREELSVAELQDILGMGQSRISSHLARLKRAGLVLDRRSGKHIYYGIAGADNPGSLWSGFKDVVLACGRELRESHRDETALAVALGRRADRARDYFNQLAGKFGRHHCPGRSWRGLSYLLISVLPPLTIADLGAGEGTLSQLLARRAKRVIAVDNSEKMVEFGGRTARENGFDNLEFRLGDIENPPIRKATIDLAILSQALHHAAVPAKAVAAARRILKPGGQIAILDLLNHNIEEARELYADQWLGFSEFDLHDLLDRAGFVGIAVSVVAKDPQDPRFQTVLATARNPR